jgi:hypothetical protein
MPAIILQSRRGNGSISPGRRNKCRATCRQSANAAFSFRRAKAPRNRAAFRDPATDNLGVIKPGGFRVVV